MTINRGESCPLRPRVCLVRDAHLTGRLGEKKTPVCFSRAHSRAPCLQVLTKASKSPTKLVIGATGKVFTAEESDSGGHPVSEHTPKD